MLYGDEAVPAAPVNEVPPKRSGTGSDTAVVGFVAMQRARAIGERRVWVRREVGLSCFHWP